MNQVIYNNMRCNGRAEESVSPRFQRKLGAITAVLTVFLAMGSVKQGAAQDDKRINKRKEELIKYTKKYEVVMGLPASTIEFTHYRESNKGEEVCGEYLHPTIIFSTSEKCRDTWPARNLVIHELCHHMMKHHITSMPIEDKEKEAATCANWYYNK